MTGPSTRSALVHLGAPLRRLALAATGFGAIGGLLFILGAAAWLARLGAFRSSAWVLGAWILALAVAGVVVWRALRQLAALAPGPLAGFLESTGRFRRGAIRFLLDSSAEGTSGALMGAADTRQASMLATEGAEAVAGERARLGRWATGAAGLAFAGALLLFGARPLAGTAAALWHPGLAWASLVAPVRLEASEAVVNRGESVTLLLTANGRREAVLWTRATGEEWSPRTVQLGRRSTVIAA
jgi:hypothetical protein